MFSDKLFVVRSYCSDVMVSGTALVQDILHSSLLFNVPVSHGFRDRGRVVFFAPTVALVKQQHEEFKRWFSALKVDYLVGPEIEEKAEINVMLRDNQVRACLKRCFYSGGSKIS